MIATSQRLLPKSHARRKRSSLKMANPNPRNRFLNQEPLIKGRSTTLSFHRSRKQTISPNISRHPGVFRKVNSLTSWYSNGWIWREGCRHRDYTVIYVVHKFPSQYQYGFASQINSTFHSHVICRNRERETDKKGGGNRNTNQNWETQTSCINVFLKLKTSNIRGDNFLKKIDANVSCWCVFCYVVS